MRRITPEVPDEDMDSAEQQGEDGSRAAAPTATLGGECLTESSG